MRYKTNCPNCGAPITGDKCEYCGTSFRYAATEAVTLYADDKAIATLEVEEPAHFGVSTAEAAEAFNRLAKLIGTGAISPNDVRREINNV